ncbi:heavy-metal-associated domain-containing protein [Gleimia hominis]|uniref:heavy-metal-associated domain-containing protein n=1 Tax=Gleimia hominis TaxID=595468 RepID=UPI000C801A72|nr:copper ion binding protein [Gleimia hominis]WIK64078.1 copper ion binding protein [Gleimia hominis]
MSAFTLDVKGLTCGHCVASVKEELGEIDGVNTVDVDLNAGEDKVSHARVETSKEISDDAIREAINEAGYDLVSINR